MRGVSVLIRDAELDRLGLILNDTFEIKQELWEQQNRAWQYVQDISTKNNPLIDRLRLNYERNRTNMCESLRLQSLAEFRRLVAEIESAVSIHSCIKGKFLLAKSEYDRVYQAFKARLKIAKAQNHDAMKKIAHRARVPNQYIDGVSVSHKSDGTVHIHFGVGGHYIMRLSDGKLLRKKASEVMVWR